MSSGETVLVTAAAGGTGQFAVQVSFFSFLICEGTFGSCFAYSFGCIVSSCVLNSYSNT